MTVSRNEVARRQWIIDLIRNEYDPAPDLGRASYPAFEKEWDDGAERIADAILALQSTAPSAPAGWKMIPLEPTEEMVVAGDEAAIEVLNDHSFALREETLARKVLRAGNAAAPTPPSQDAASDTGNAEADRLIGRLTSADPDFNDCTDAALLIRQLVIEHKGPDGYATWKDAAIAERMRRTPPAQDAGDGWRTDFGNMPREEPVDLWVRSRKGKEFRVVDALVYLRDNSTTILAWRYPPPPPVISGETQR